MGTAVFIVLWLLVIVGAFYVILVRPQRRRMMDHQRLVDSVAPGDQIITTGGLIGEIEVIDDATMKLRIADGVVVDVARGAIAHKIVDDEPTAEPEVEAAESAQ